MRAPERPLQGLLTALLWLCVGFLLAMARVACLLLHGWCIGCGLGLIVLLRMLRLRVAEPLLLSAESSALMREMEHARTYEGECVVRCCMVHASACRLVGGATSAAAPFLL